MRLGLAACQVEVRLGLGLAACQVEVEAGYPLVLGAAQSLFLSVVELLVMTLEG